MEVIAESVFFSSVAPYSIPGGIGEDLNNLSQTGDRGFSLSILCPFMIPLLGPSLRREMPASFETGNASNKNRSFCSISW